MENVNLPQDQLQLYKLLIQANQKQTSEIKAEIQQNLTSVIEKLEKTNKEVQYLKKKCINLERKGRKNNVIIFGLDAPSDNLLQTTLETINSLLGTNIKEENVNNIYTIGRSANPPIALEFVSFLTKKSLFHDKEKLKNLKEHKITISNDLCVEDREEIQILRKHLKLARAQNYEAQIKGFRLFINNTPYTAGELIKIEEQEQETDSEENSGEDEESVNEEEKGRAGLSIKFPTSKADQDKTSKQLQLHNQPVVEENTAVASKRKRRKINRYSPKNTRSKK